MQHGFLEPCHVDTLGIEHRFRVERTLSSHHLAEDSRKVTNVWHSFDSKASLIVSHVRRSIELCIASDANSVAFIVTVP